MFKPVLGIIGGGQLGSMLSQAAKKLDIRTIVYCDDKDAPAQHFADEFIFGEYDEINKLKEFCYKVDIITYEFENIPFNTLQKLNDEKKVLDTNDFKDEFLKISYGKKKHYLIKIIR